MKKILSAFLFAFVLTLVTATSVSANTTYSFYNNVTVPKRQTVYTSYVTAGYNFKFALNNITSSAGSAAIHTTYQTKYSGSAVTIGNSIKFTGTGYTGAVLWRPTGVTSNPTGGIFSIADSKNCSGNNTTSNYCAIANSEYRLKISNQNYLNQFVISGSFVLTD